MEIIEFNENQKDQWSEFIKQNAPDGGVLQSFEWGEFKKSLGHQVFYLAVLENNQISAAALLIKHQLPFGLSYLYCPRGPVINQIANNNQQIAILELLIKKINEIAKKEKAIFLRFEPAPALDLEKFGFKKTGFEVQPRQTLVLDISKSETELLAQMKSKTRYNINLAQKRGVKVEVGDDRFGFSDFFNLLQQTAARQKIKNYSKLYYQKLLEVLGQGGNVKLFLAKYQNKTIAALILVIFGNTGYYFFGGSDGNYKQVMAPYLLQWESIKLAKNLGCTHYDFWGVSDKKSSWQGITRFKVGFVPSTPFAEYFGVWDLIYQPLIYKLYKFYKIFF